jgi:hypothetical protein
MRKTLKISLLLNLILLGCLILTLKSARNAGNRAMVIATASTAKPPNAAAPAAMAPPAETRPFHWNQLFAATNDYRIYVANLRAAGCPERTVRAIVMADVNNVFFDKRAELHLDGRESGPWSGQNEATLIADLLGERSVADPALAANAEPQPDTTAPLPLVFQRVDLNALGLNDDEKAAIEGLRQQFIEEIGGTNQNPSDPVYLARWQQARPEIDDSLRGMIGVKAFENYQSAAIRWTDSPSQTQ